MNTVVSVQARLGSSRLPGKVLLNLGPRRVIEWVLHRCDAARSDLDRATTVVAIGDEPENDALTEYCQRNGREWVVGSEDDLLQRHLAVLEQYDADRLVRVTGDCPFVPAPEIDRLVQAHEHNSARYTTNIAESMPIGTAVDVLDTALLAELAERGDNHPVRRLRRDRDQWDVAVTPNPEWEPFADAHVAVDTPEDYWTLTDAVAAVGEAPRSVAAWMAEHRVERSE